MADKLVETNLDIQIDDAGALWGPYWIDKDIAVIVFVDDADEAAFARTTDGGDTWSTTAITTGQDVKNVACWFDQETPGDAGTLVHIVWGDDEGEEEDLFYNTVDVSDAAVGTERTVDS